MTSKLTFKFNILWTSYILITRNPHIDKYLNRRKNSAELDKWTGQELKRLLSDIFVALSSEPAFEKVEFKSMNVHLSLGSVQSENLGFTPGMLK